MKKLLGTIGKWLLKQLGRLCLFCLKLAWRIFLFCLWAICELLAALFAAVAKFLKEKVTAKS